MLQMETVERQNGTLARSAARAACTSPRRASMPEMPIGPKPNGKDHSVPNSDADTSIFETSFSTRWRSSMAARSATLRRSVCSA
jgi:hypothetical protein